MSGERGARFASFLGMALFLAAMILAAGYFSAPLTGAGQSMICSVARYVRSLVSVAND